MAALFFWVGLAAVVGCEEGPVAPPPPPPAQPQWEIKPDSMNVAILVLDYLTYEFEGGRVDHFAPCDTCDADSIPFDQIYMPPVDIGNTTFRYTETGDTVLFAYVIWNGDGFIKYPNDFLRPDAFSYTAVSPQPPLSVEYYSNAGKTSPFANADTAWSHVRALDVHEAFASRPYRVGIYLHVARAGAGGADMNNWVIFLYTGPALNSITTPASATVTLRPLF